MAPINAPEITRDCSLTRASRRSTPADPYVPASKTGATRLLRRLSRRRPRWLRRARLLRELQGRAIEEQRQCHAIPRFFLGAARCLRCETDVSGVLRRQFVAANQVLPHDAGAHP